MSLTPRQRAAELCLSLAALAAALQLNYRAGLMADAAGRLAHASPDLVWRWLPVLDTRLVFVSAHTAMPFLAYLVFRGFWVRLSFLAYFITYALHRAEARWFQPFYGRLRDRLLAG